MDDDLRATIDLLDYRRQVADLYHRVRGQGKQRDGWELWRAGRHDLFARHPASPYDAAAWADSGGLHYFPHDPTFRVEAAVEAAPQESFSIAHSADGATRAIRVGAARFRLADVDCALSLYWLDQYGGGLFVPFRDETSNETTYGGGRYLLDTAKSADLGSRDGRLVFDFNFAYHPSCYHDPRWSCPLAPPENRLPVAVTAGERSTAS